MKISKDLKTQATEIANKEITNYIKDLPQTVKFMMNGALLSILGLEKRSYGQYEIDHCNGRSSVLIDVIRSMAAKEVEQIVKKTYKPSKEEITLFVDAFRKEYTSQLQSALKTAAREQALLDAKKMVAESMPDILKEVEKMNEKAA